MALYKIPKPKLLFLHSYIHIIHNTIRLFLFTPEQPTNEQRQGIIPKEAPWKTSALNERFRKKRNSEFSTATSGTERKRGFVGIFLAAAPLCQNVLNSLPPTQSPPFLLFPSLLAEITPQIPLPPPPFQADSPIYSPLSNSLFPLVLPPS